MRTPVTGPLLTSNVDSDTDASGRDRQVDYSMPAALIESDLAVPLRFQVRDANAAIVQAINDYGNATKGVQIKAVQRGKKVAISGRARSRKAMKKAKWAAAAPAVPKATTAMK